ncbi:MAG: type II toxin-antitoxin system RelE/ParE family toxin [Sphingomonadales bacterium]|nr:type II toxin-antitoxin system RelE/ParE family toxin [Sphingomonadales bacterium]
MQEIIWSGPALEDLRRISAWLMDNADGETAVRILAMIRAACVGLENFPSRGPMLVQGTRKFRVAGTRYLILYRAEPSRLIVTRVFHARENWQLEI